jgi:Fur family transcriptional regulator, iron response regulator
MKPAEIAEFLKARGLRVSLQKLEIARHVLAEHRHFTAEEIFKEINVDFPRVSRATVFNVLNLFVEHGLLKTVQARSDVLFYDSNATEHDHVVVAKSGEIFDVTIPEAQKQSLLKGLWAKNPQLPRTASAAVVVHI